MKLDILESHDRLKYLIKDQSANIYEGAEDCFLRNPLSLAIQDKSPYVYIFAHPRTHENGVDKVLYWQPRLSIPTPATNSYLFRALSKSDVIEVIWMIPPREHWDQYKSGNVTESNYCVWSINRFTNDRISLSKPHPNDLPEEKSKMIMKSIVDEHLHEIKRSKLKTSEDFSSVF